MLDLAQLQAMFSKDFFTNQKALREFKESKKYYHGSQISEINAQKARARGLPPLYENLFKTICDKILGYKLQSQTEIKVIGRQYEDKPLANLLCDLLKWVRDGRGFEKEIYKRDFDLLMGISVLELWIYEKKENYFIDIKALPIESFLIDSYSTDKNALDATRFHKKINVSVADLKGIIGEKEVYLSKSDLADNRAYINETWVKEVNKSEECGYSWNRYLWHDNGGIYLHEIKPLKNNTHPFIVAKYNIDHDYNAYGLFRDIKPLQDYINFSENKMANMINNQKALFERGAVENIEEFKDALSRDNAIVEVHDGALREGKIQFQNNSADIAALSQKAEQKKQMAKIISGLNDEALAMASNRQSGVAITQRREAGLLGLQYYIITADEADRLLYEKILSLIQHYFTKEQSFLIVDKDIGERYFNINDGEKNKIEIGEFDLIYTTKLKQLGREERFAYWSEMLKGISAMRPDLASALLPFMLKDTDSPVADDVENIIRNADENQAKQAEAQAPMQQKLQELEAAKLQAEVNKINAEVAKMQAQAAMLATAQAQVENGEIQSENGQVMRSDDSDNPLSKIDPEIRKKMQISLSDMR
ncbi:MAG: portal protein [Helicobacteraceae bacterium]|nr:portal protein [Helicobacteraceae bacterium]